MNLLPVFLLPELLPPYPPVHDLSFHREFTTANQIRPRARVVRAAVLVLQQQLRALTSGESVPTAGRIWSSCAKPSRRGVEAAVLVV